MAKTSKHKKNLPEKSVMTKLAIRGGKLSDIQQLVDLENRSFPGDRLSSSNFRYFLIKGNCTLAAGIIGGKLACYGLVLYRKGSAIARIYSLAVDQSFQGRGLAQSILLFHEKAARKHGCAELRLEVRKDNPGAIKLYLKLGYQEFNRKSNYYEDGMEALCFQKILAVNPKPDP